MLSLSLSLPPNTIFQGFKGENYVLNYMYGYQEERRLVPHKHTSHSSNIFKLPPPQIVYNMDSVWDELATNL